MIKIQLKLPYRKAHWLDQIHQKGQVFEEKYLNEEILLTARVTKEMASRLEKYLIID